MDSLIWQRVKNLVGDALDQPETKRSEFVAGSGEDTTVRREAESILAQSAERLEICAENLSAATDESFALAGEHVGPYEIIRELGRGGMGAVYLARRADGAFEKEVAIKILKRGTDTDEVLKRFQAERQIVARLNHAHIAVLFDAGTTDEGLPYFVMEHVNGEPITIYARRHELSINQRLELFRSVCSAVSHAHQNLIIHRDIKPSNVLVTGAGEVKLLDFGIAKLLDDSVPEVTITLQRRMTPEYASPEQVRGEAVTTLSDVYSLGALLYQLLTEERPYRVATRTHDEIAKAICEQEPTKPSTALAKSISNNPQCTFCNPKLLRGDLDNIVLKALRKEPQRRYASVDQFSADIRRYLEGLPVRARKDTPIYRASKFVRRHKFGVAAAAVVALALIAGTVTTAWQAHQARVEKEIAEQRFNQVRQLAHSVLFDYHDAIAALPGSTLVRERLVGDALQYLDNLSKQAGDDISLLRELATAYEKVAAVQGSVASSSKGNALTQSNLGNTSSALDDFGKALAIWQRASALKPNDKDVQYGLAHCYALTGELYMVIGPPEKALQNLQKARPMYEALLAANPKDQTLRLNLVNNYGALSQCLGNPAGPNLGKPEMALMYLNRALPIMEQLAAEQPSNRMYQLYIAGLHLNIGRVLTSMSGREGEALDQAQQALAIGKELARLEPTNTLFQSQLDIQLSLAGKARLKIGDNAGAMENLTQALNISESLIAKDPHDANARKLLAGSYRNLAEGLSTTGDYTSALKNLHQAEKIFRDLAAADPANLATNMTLEQVEAEITKWTAALKSSTSRVAQ